MNDLPHALWYRVVSAADDSCTPLAAWEHISVDRIYCSECGYPRDRSNPIDVPVENKPRARLAYVQGAGIGIIGEDVLRALGDFAGRLLVGNLLSASGQPIRSHRTFLGSARTLVRGGPNSSARLCSLCGQLSYLPIGDFYLRQAPVAEVSEDELHALVVSATVASLLESVRGLRLSEIPIVETPSDGVDDAPGFDAA